jgi:hypothetical protein
MSELAFLSPALAQAVDGIAPRYRSPLERALAGGEHELRDLSALGKVEVRSGLDAALEGQSHGRGLNGDVAQGRGPQGHVRGTVPEVVRVTPTRALVLCEPEAAPVLAAQLAGIDISAALAGLAVRGEQLLRRLTDLDLERLPAIGAVAGVRCTVLRDGDEFRLFFAQEYADHVAAVVLDAMAGLR